jgi:sulfate adenylyltransferase
MRSKTRLIPPHGGRLVDLMVDDPAKKQKLVRESKGLSRIRLSTLEFSDLIMLGTGAFSPLEGFMTGSDYRSVLGNMRLADGTLWPLPVTITIDDTVDYKTGDTVALISPYTGEVAGNLYVEDIFHFDNKAEAIASFGTNDTSHPGAKKLDCPGKYHIGGRVRVFTEGGYPENFSAYARPSEVRDIFVARKWKTIVAFQTRNPIHRSHEYLTKVVLETSDGIFIHPIVGKLKEGDIPAEIRMRCYEVLIDNYYPEDKVLLKVYPMEMRYAGPKEAVLHAIIRQNYGCSHIVIGRDHAGVGDFYGPFEAQEIFDAFSDDDLLIKPVKMGWTFYCQKCKSMASFKTCPHPDKDHIMISGTKLRTMLSSGQCPPEYIIRKEVADILIDYYKGSALNDQGK